MSSDESYSEMFEALRVARAELREAESILNLATDGNVRLINLLSGLLSPPVDVPDYEALGYPETELHRGFDAAVTLGERLSKELACAMFTVVASEFLDNP